MYVRNLKLFISLSVEISPFGRNDNNGDCETVSKVRVGQAFAP
jgi:hypothetical protein